MCYVGLYCDGFMLLRCFLVFGIAVVYFASLVV